MDRNSDKRYMQMALDLARKAEGKTSPNPMVGAVIVKKNSIIGKGYHRRAGTPHAEIVALKNAKESVKGSTIYLNLEPCCHRGRTGPCAPELIKAGIKKVIYAMKDPNPEVKGRGIAMLRKHGIETIGGVLKKEAERLNEVFIKFISTRRPYVVLKLAQTLDGRIATSNGDSKWITGTKARAKGHYLRSIYDAVVVGSGTVIADNPNLTVRAVKGDNPYRIVLAANTRLKMRANLFVRNNDAKTIVAVPRGLESKIKFKNAIVWSLKKSGHTVSLTDFISRAGAFGITSLLIEGGSGVATEFLKSKLIDKIHVFLAPKIIGRGIEGIGDLGIKKISRGIDLKDTTIESIGKDMMFTGYPEY